MHAHLGALVEAGARAELAGHHRGRHGAGLDIGGDADAAQLAARRRFLATLLEARVVGGFESHVERLEIIAAVVGERHRRGVGEGVVGDEVAPAELHRVDLHLARRAIDEALDDIAGLRAPGAAIGVDRRGVGEDSLDLDIDRRRGVVAGEQGAVAPGGNRRREAAEIGPEIGQRGDTHGEELAVRVEGELRLGEVVARLVVGEEDLAAVGRPLDGTAKPGGEPQNQRLLVIERALGAKATAHIGCYHTQLVLGKLQDESGDQQPVHMRRLARCIEGVVAGGAVMLADGGARLHRVGDQPIVDELEARHVMGAREGSVDRRLVAEMPVEAEIAGGGIEQQRPARLDGLVAGDHRRQLPVVDLDQLGRGFRLLARFGHDHRHGVADMAHLALGEHRAHRLGHRRAVLRGDEPAARQAAYGGLKIGAGVDRRDTRRRQGLGRIDAGNLRMGMRAAQQAGLELAGPVDVVGVFALAREEAQVFLAPD